MTPGLDSDVYSDQSHAVQDEDRLQDLMRRQREREEEQKRRAEAEKLAHIERPSSSSSTQRAKISFGVKMKPPI